MMTNAEVRSTVEKIIPSEWLEGTLKNKFQITDTIEISHKPDSYDPHIISISWKLGSDPMRSNKRSKKIIIEISRELIDDCLENGDNDFNSYKDIFIEFIRTFNPEHQEPFGATSPIEYCHLK